MPRRSLNVNVLISNLLDYFTKEKNNGGPLISVLRVQRRVADALQISERTVQRVVKHTSEGLSVSDSDGDAESDDIPGDNDTGAIKRNCVVKIKKTRNINDSQKHEIRHTIYTMYTRREHITLDTLLTTLRDKYIVSFSRTSLYRVLKDMGFKYKKGDNRRALCEQAHIKSLRIKFLRNYCRFLQEGTFDFVFTDETWIFSRGSKKKSWQDENTRSVKNMRYEGKRFIVLHAGTRDGFIDGADLVFCGKSKSADYHDNMNFENYKQWVKNKLLPSLEKPSVIVIDNAPYHSVALNPQPNGSWKKEDIKKWLDDNKIPYSPIALKAELLDLSSLNKSKKKYVIDEMVNEYGHVVLRLPPYHCQFNPIEMVWGICKNYYDRHIGRDGYSDEDVKNMWKEALSTVTPETWRKTVEKVEQDILQAWDHEKLLDVSDILPLVINIDSDSSSESEFEDNLIA